MNKIRKFLGLALAIVISFVANPVEVSAKEMIQTMNMVEVTYSDDNEVMVYEGVNNFAGSKLARNGGIVSASLAVTPKTDEILIVFTTQASFTASVIGVRDVYVQEKVWYGWKTIAQANASEAASNVFTGQCKCTNATKGKTYRVLCTHYAYEVDGTEHVVENQSEEFVYN